MNVKITLFIIISLILVVPSINAQEISIGGKANQKSVEVIISEEGNVHIKHIVGSANSPKQLKLIEGTIQNLTITNEEGEKQLLTIVGDNTAIIISPSRNNSIIEYDLEDVLLLKNNLWTLDFLYLETTTFIIPEKLDLIFINDRLVYLDDKKGFSCHGCQMILQYAINEPKRIMEVDWEDKKFLIEIRTLADLENFEFDQSAKKISFKINEDKQFITTIMPLELLWEPYVVFLNDEKIIHHDYINNGTHVWINIHPNTIGEVTIIGTTVVPEFSIIAPLAIGFLMILVVPVLKKVNLR